MQYVQFSDSSEVAVVSVFGNPQDPGEYPNQGEVQDDDPRYLEFMTPKVGPVITDPIEKLKAFLDEGGFDRTTCARFCDAQTVATLDLLLSRSLGQESQQSFCILLYWDEVQRPSNTGLYSPVF